MEEPKSYSIEKLNESNYRSWSQVVESHLDEQDLWEVVQGKDKKPERPSTPSTSTAQTSEQTAAAVTATAAAMEDYEAKLEVWTKKAKKARKMIISTISPSVMTYVEGTKDPAEMWTILEGRYKPKSSVTLRQLQRQFMMRNKVNSRYYVCVYCKTKLVTARYEDALTGNNPTKKHILQHSHLRLRL
jgi:hypothetical protein